VFHSSLQLVFKIFLLNYIFGESGCGCVQNAHVSSCKVSVIGEQFSKKLNLPNNIL